MIKNILWDFDGVILDSMQVRDYGFRKIFEEHTHEQVEKLIKYHRTNGGWSRYVKIRYFYEEILGQNISEKEVLALANKFSNIMREELIKPEHLIDDSLKFIENNHTNFNFHIVSGSDENELRFLCKELKLDSYFITINGSPIAKNKLVFTVLKDFGYKKEETILIGDSINDYEAAKVNSIEFYGYNNTKLMEQSREYIESFDEHQLR
ncbi:phosphoglycolate phosphatase-like HAD superfamily hydrolase [Maribacter spongiicola]|uniref:phosphoglycolate phosphatase n=1 Tax=Maribacter spongiicola TaxID=1206753 RepID=A0A4R7K8R8_9FLAO|nr:HAD hydrolase-like protein [Maribacter spongiicola]TDT46344.1 phosphoglycolate phosphatase-like HAD superfamily hydrolase [Maribacter spongiicola]